MQCVQDAEEARIAALQDYRILDTAPDQAFDRLTRLARLALQVPIVLISLVDRDRQWFKSKQGLDITETSLSVSFCVYAIQQTKPFIVTDARLHPLFRDNPLVTGKPFIRFYAGTPLTMKSGFVIGTLCVIDTRARVLSTEEVDVLQDIGEMVISEIELRQIAKTDSLTGTLTRRGFDTEIVREYARAQRSHHAISLLALDVDHFKSVNDRYGHATGDAVLQSLVTAIRSELRIADFVGRMGGEEFVIALPDTDLAGAVILAERIRVRIASAEIEVHGSAIRITASIGIAACDVAQANWTKAFRNADMALYRAKASGRNKCVCHEQSPSSEAA